MMDLQIDDVTDHPFSISGHLLRQSDVADADWFPV
jgi:hypothetical protein